MFKYSIDPIKSVLKKKLHILNQRGYHFWLFITHSRECLS